MSRTINVSAAISGVILALAAMVTGYLVVTALTLPTGPLAPTVVTVPDASATEPTEAVSVTRVPTGPTVDVCGTLHSETHNSAIASVTIPEIEANAFPAICEVNWNFIPLDSKSIWGQAHDSADNRIDISSDTLLYTDGTKAEDFQIEFTIAHELGHHITFQHFPNTTEQEQIDSEIALEKYFTGKATEEIDGWEISADILAACILPDNPVSISLALTPGQIDRACDMVSSTDTLN